MPQLEFIIFLVDFASQTAFFATVVVPVLAGNMPAVSGWPCEGHKSTCISIVSRNSIAKYQQYASESNLIQNGWLAGWLFRSDYIANSASWSWSWAELGNSGLPKLLRAKMSNSAYEKKTH